MNKKYFQLEYNNLIFSGEKILKYLMAKEISEKLNITKN